MAAIVRVPVCSVEDLPDGARRVVAAGGRAVAVFNLDGSLFALDNECAHRAQPLAEGTVRNGILTCPAHLWRYCVRTGERVDSGGGWAVASHGVSVVDGTIVVEVPEPVPAKSIRDQLLDHARAWSRDE